MTVPIPTAMSPTDVIATIRREVTSLDPNLPIYDVRTLTLGFETPRSWEVPLVQRLGAAGVTPP